MRLKAWLIYADAPCRPHLLKFGNNIFLTGRSSKEQTLTTFPKLRGAERKNAFSA